MTILNDEELEKLTKLCRIKCTEDERLKLASNISKIISYMDLLEEVDTTDVEPCSHIMQLNSSVMRQDEVMPTLSREEFLSNAPAHIGGMIRVPPIIKSSK
jgi:aspartyl-tRNA(Asn)/glutamyl-tRNA(Gln) amidotransferase subunit C